MNFQKQKRDNCFETCLAILLGIDQDKVPEFSGDGWVESYDNWLQENYGLRIICCLLAEPFIYCIPKDVSFIISGELEEGGWHSRIMKADEIIHDPSTREHAQADFAHGYHKWHATVLIKDFYT